MRRCAAILLIVCVFLLFVGCTTIHVPEQAVSYNAADETASVSENKNISSDAFTLDNLPEYSGSPWIALYNNIPDFSQEELASASYEYYSPLDELGRCGPAIACIGPDLMPTEPRGAIGQVKPSGWQTVKYDVVDGKYLYNRCHLIGYQLTGENANACNLITGTRYLNIQGMLPFENMVADYIVETENHVLYSVTPIFSGNELVARGVHLQAQSIEDGGEGVLFNVYCYNVQPGIHIDYTTGSSYATEADPDASAEITCILNTKTMKFHNPDCSSVQSIKTENYQAYSGSRDSLISLGYTPCGNCRP